MEQHPHRWLQWWQPGAGWVDGFLHIVGKLLTLWPVTVALVGGDVVAIALQRRSRP